MSSHTFSMLFRKMTSLPSLLLASFVGANTDRNAAIFGFATVVL